MRIAMLLSTALPAREGVGFYVWNLANCLRDLGHNVTFITRRHANQALKEQIDGFTIWRPAYYPVYPLHVHLHGLFTNRVVRALEPEIDLFHIHSPLPPPIKTRRPVMLTFHSSVYDDLKDLQVKNFNRLIMRLQTPVSYRMENRLLKGAQVVNVVSPYLKKVIGGYPEANGEIQVNWNGVDTHLFSPNGRERQGFVLTTGRLDPVKGLRDLMAAAQIVNQQLGPTRFVIAGEGPSRAMLEREIEARGLVGQVELVGHVADRSQLVELYRSASLFVSASHKEGLPTVMLEAMAAGCPVVVTAIGGNPDVISHGEDGLLVPPHQPEELAAAIIAMLSDPDRLAAMGQAARKTVESTYSWAAISRMYIDQYEQMIAGAAV